MFFVILGMLFGALLLFAVLTGLKWLGAVCLVLGGCLVLAFVGHRYRNIERFLVLIFIPLSSVKIDVHLLRIGGDAGFAITPLNIVWALLMILWMINIWRGQEKVTWRSEFAVPLLIILVGALIAGARSHAWVAGARGVLQVFQCLTLFVYLLNRKTSEREARLFYWAICLTLGGQALLGVMQGVTGSTFGSQYLGGSAVGYMEGSKGGVTISRVGGSIGHSNSYALYLNSLIFVPFAVMLAKRSDLSRRLGTVVLLISVAALVMSKSRGSWAGFAICGVLFAFVLLRERIGAPKASVVVVGLALAMITLALLIPATRVRLVGDDYGAARSRIPMSMTALNMIAHHPLLGVGGGNYKQFYHEYDNTPEGHTYQFRYVVHNAYLLIAAESGIPVLLAYLAALLIFLHAVLRRPTGPENVRSRTIAYALGVGILARSIIWQVEVGYPLASIYTWFLMGLAISLSRVGQDEVAEDGAVTQLGRASSVPWRHQGAIEERSQR